MARGASRTRPVNDSLAQVRLGRLEGRPCRSDHVRMAPGERAVRGGHQAKWRPSASPSLAVDAVYRLAMG